MKTDDKKYFFKWFMYIVGIAAICISLVYGLEWAGKIQAKNLEVWEREKLILQLEIAEKTVKLSKSLVAIYKGTIDGKEIEIREYKPVR